MFQRKFKALSGNKVLFGRRGQVAILFALMMPIFILMLGVVLDLGWYYLNVSRLQNAADAAAVAGANALREDEYFSDYKNIKLVGKYPGKDSNKYRVDNIYELTAIENTNVIAEEYVAKNLSSNEDTIINSWTKSEVASDEGLYTKDNNLYYVVKLKEDIRHFFLPGWFDDMTAPVTAVALLSKTAIKGDSTSDDGESPTMPTMPTFNSSSDDDDVVNEDQQNAIEKVLNENMIVGNWEVQSKYKDHNKESDKKYYLKDEYGDFIADPETGKPTMITDFQRRFGYSVYSKKWNHYQDLKNHYKTGEHRRTETIEVVPNKTGLYNVPNRKNGEGNSYTTSANGNNIYSEEEVDSLNIDFRQDVEFEDGKNDNGKGISKYLSQDWDFSMNNYADTNYDEVHNLTNNDGYTMNSPAIYMRIHGTMNFNMPHKTRSSSTDDPDILWVRIESEPMLYHPDTLHGETSSNVTIKQLNSVRQIILNFNKDNTGKDENDKDIYRPLIIFYDGPERYSESDDIRDSKPVIVNLNDNFQGVLYAPNSPVVLNDNGKNFTGFIVAKSYLRLKTEDEFYQDPVDGKYYASAADKTNEYFKIEETHNGVKNTMFIDAHGEVQYAELSDPPPKYGDYDNFGRTTFATHGYTVLKTSANNLLLSGR